MSENNRNGIHIRIDASAGTKYAGLHWIPVPEDGVPADLLPHVQRYLGRCEHSSYAQILDVTAATWEGVRAAVESTAAKEAAEDAAKEAADTEWRRLVTAYLNGGPKPAHTLDTEAGHFPPPDDLVTAIREEDQRRAAAAKADLSARVLTLLPRLEAGEGVLWRTSISLDDQKLSWGVGEIDPLVQQQIDQLVERRTREAKEAEEAEKARRLAERDAWIQEHGSERLKKAVAAGLVPRSHGVYTDERIRHELGPDWIQWASAPEPSSREHQNPEEHEIDALLLARETYGAGVELVSVGGEDDDGERWAWRPALLMDAPWDARIQVMRYVDGEDSGE